MLPDNQTENVGHSWHINLFGDLLCTVFKSITHSPAGVHLCTTEGQQTECTDCSIPECQPTLFHWKTSALCLACPLFSPHARHSPSVVAVSLSSTQQNVGSVWNQGLKVSKLCLKISPRWQFKTSPRHLPGLL